MELSWSLTTSIKESFKGKLVWLSGAPGMGKSTSAQYLAKDHGFVYYEADAFGLLLNPFNTLESDNPSLATSSQRVLKGELPTYLQSIINLVSQVPGRRKGLR